MWWYDGSSALNDLWEWDQTTDTWAQKANMPAARFSHSGFVISGKAYVGIGEMDASGGQYNDWWEYDPSANTWIQKTNFLAGYRGYTEYFSIGSKGYICAGIQYSPVTYQNDLWEYDATANGWTQKSNFPGSVRGEAVSFVSNGIAYFGMGKLGSSSFNDIWKWDPIANTWTQVTTFPGNARIDASTFVLCGEAYFVTGWLASQSGTTKEVWKYSPPANTWLQLPNFPGNGSLDQAYFSIGTKGYVATGYDYSNPPSQELWEYAANCSEGGVNELSEQLIPVTIYPNPFINETTVSIGGNDFKEYQFTIYDVNGQVLKSLPIKCSSKLAKESLSPGIYFYSLTREGKRYNSGEFIIQ